ncbi:MAG TPA: STAS domain-containing protein [Gaiellales bacterium]|jgi:anti-anti-sigma factor|nr:STAS domain-containing protein [Gaiellales bacterium]
MHVPRIVTEQPGEKLWVVALEGEHDLSTAQGLRRECDRIFELGTCLVVDLTSATFIDSSILRELVESQRRADSEEGEGFAVVAPAGSAAAKVFEMVGAREILAIFPTRAEAVEWCRGSEATTA